jgi:hypothetical protein
VVLAEILHGLDNSVYIDEDSVLGSQVPQELRNEAACGSDDEDMQDLSHPLDLNRYVVNMEKQLK